MNIPRFASTPQESPVTTTQAEQSTGDFSDLKPPKSFELRSEQFQDLPLPSIPGLTWTATATFPPEGDLSLDFLKTLPSGSQIVLSAGEKFEGGTALPVQPNASIGASGTVNGTATIKLEVQDGAVEGERLHRITATLRGEIGGDISSSVTTPWITVPSAIRESAEALIDRLPLPSRLKDVMEALIGDAPGARARAGVKTIKEGTVSVDLSPSTDDYREQFAALLTVSAGSTEKDSHPPLRCWWQTLSNLPFTMVERSEVTVNGGIAVSIPTQSPLSVAEARQTNGSETARSDGHAMHRLWREAQLLWFGTERDLRVNAVQRGQEECACISFNAAERPQLTNILPPVALARKLAVTCSALAQERVEKVRLPRPTLRQVVSGSDMLHVAYTVHIGNDQLGIIRASARERGALKAYLKADGDLHQTRSDRPPRPIAPSLTLLDILEPDDNTKRQYRHAAARAREIFEKTQGASWKLGGFLLGKEMRESYRALTGRDLDRDVKVSARAKEFQRRFDTLSENSGCDQGLNHLLLGFADTRRFCPFTPIAAIVNLGQLSREDLTRFELISANKEIDIKIGGTAERENVR